MSILMKKIVIIGSGFSSLSAACYLAQMGHKVIILEKNRTIGGRARQFSKDGFTFDMGPTFYWMPDIFDDFFNDFNKKTSDFYHLDRLDPGYQVYFNAENSISISSDISEIYKTFEREEKGSSKFLKSFLKSAEFNYRVAIDKVIYKPGKSICELIMPATIFRSFQFIQSLSSRVKKGVKSKKLQSILEFPVLFLGAKASKTPAFYCLMNYADMGLGTWHIQGGMFRLVESMSQLAKSYGVEIVTNSPVSKIIVKDGFAIGVKVGDAFWEADVVISGADYHHSETLLEKSLRNYTSDYWAKKVFAPSALLYYVAFNKKIDNVSHHTLFFDTDFEQHAKSIYDEKSWPKDPLFYASFPSISDSSMAPKNMEAGIFLIPIAPGLEDKEEIREQYFVEIIKRLEKITGQELSNSILFNKSYSVNNFIKDYNAYKGNAYGLANTLMQTAFLKPKMRNKKVKNIFYTGQLTVPGPGVPTAIISGKIVSGLVSSYLKKIKE